MKEPSIIYHNNDPFIGYYKQVASQKECQKLMDLAKDTLKPSAIIGYSEIKLSNARKSEQAQFRHYSDPIVQQVSERIASIVGQPLNHAENMQIVRYPIGGKFDVHYDVFNSSTKLGKAYISKGGQRMITAILYLNTVSAGGETFFPALSLEVSPSQGDLLVFENCRQGTNQANQNSRHGARPVKAGEKWIATLWFREKPQY